MNARTRRRLRTSSWLLVAAVLAGCGSNGTSGTVGSGEQRSNATDSGGPIVVWVDPPRVPAAEAFKKAHPEIPMTMNTIDGNVGSTVLQQKFSLFNQAGKGWPDAIFFPSNDDIAWATSSKIDFARDLSTDMKDTIAGYSPASISPCVIDGKVRCIRNDAAPDVFWYNATLFDKWGYSPPTSWEQYGTLAMKIAREHPGYLSGLLGDAYAPDRYLWASGCPTNDRMSETKVHINLADPLCSRVVSLVDKLVDAKALSPVGIFDPAAAKVGQKLAMSPGAVWWGNYLFRDTWKIPAKQMTATTPLKWADDPRGYTGDEGGGLWGVSSHIKGKQLANALTFAKFVAGDPAWQVELTTGMPAYGPIQDAWLRKQSSNGYLADFQTSATAFKSAVDAVRPKHAYMLYNTGGIWTQTVTPLLTQGKNLSAAWDAFGKRLNNEARTFGYQVVTSS
jgi:ABC-type glycerol-3-phosphate transport system substrate-binding protein